MKKFLLLIFSFVLSSGSLLHGQFCSAQPAICNGYDPLLNNPVFDGPYYFRVYIHIVNQQQPESAAEEAFEFLNDGFNGKNIFFEWDCHVDFIENFVPDINNPENAEEHVFNINNHDDGIDIYLFNNTLGSRLGTANGVGGSSEFAVFEPQISEEVTVHEMGHVLCLYHTDTESPCKDNPGIDTDDEECGDYVSDTPEDPGLQIWIGSVDDINCIFIETDIPQDDSGEINWTYTDTDPTNYMSFGPRICKGTFSDGQMIRAKNAIQMLPFLQACLLDDQPHIIGEYEEVTIDNHQAYYNDVIIEIGATLIIESTVSMRKGKEIIVEEGGKLIVRGGEISNYCDELWGGIKVVGKHQTQPQVALDHVEVELTDNFEEKRSVISNVDDAAVSMIPPLDFPQILNYGNGILEAENTTFTNVEMMVRFIAMRPSLNQSSIFNCIQNGGTYGVKNWNCLNIEISNNKFYDISKYCIENEDGALIIDENEFHSQEIDVFFNFVNPPLLISTTQNNYFLGSAIGLVYLGGTQDENDVNEVSNNTFINNQINAQFEGKNRFDFTQNSLKNNLTPQFGFQCANSGTFSEGVNRIDQNSFDQNVMAMYLQGNNENVVFRSNCFNSVSSSPFWGAFDIYIKERVHPMQASGNDDAPANNCFTHQGAANSSVFDIQGYSFDQFLYVEPGADQPADPCKFAILAHPDVNKFQTGEAFPEECGTQQTVVLPPDCCNLDSDSPYGMLLESRYQELRSELMNSSKIEDKIIIFQSFIHEGEFELARNYLTSLNDFSEELQDFFFIQSLYIDKYTEGENYNLNQIQMESILNIAQKNHVYSAYAKSLYYRLTGILLLEPFPDMNQNQQQRVSKDNNDTLRSVNISPNPFNNELTIDLNLEEESKIFVFDVSGKVIFSRKVEIGQDCLIQTTNWRQGIYFCQIKSNKEILHQEKLILIH